MSLENRALLSIAALSLLIATIAGALASHVLTALPPGKLHSFEIAVQFQFFHGLGLLALTGLRARHGGLALRLAAWLLVAGTVLFCGTIYATTLGAPTALGSAAPIGGIAFMIAWLCIAWGAWGIKAT